MICVYYVFTCVMKNQKLKKYKFDMFWKWEMRISMRETGGVLNSEWDLLVGRNLPWELKYQADMYDSLINLE